MNSGDHEYGDYKNISLQLYTSKRSADVVVLS